MKKKFVFVVLVLALGYRVEAQSIPSYIGKPQDAAGIFAIWPGSGVPPGSEKWTWHEQTTQSGGNRMIRNIVIPTVTMFRPAHANGTAVIVAPGGAFTFLMVDYEGYDVARWLARQGVTAFVLKYRVSHSPDNDADMPPFLDWLRSEPAFAPFRDDPQFRALLTN